MTPKDILDDKTIFMGLLKQAYEAGQKSVYCGCYEIEACKSFNKWVFETLQNNKVEDDNEPTE